LEFKIHLKTNFSASRINCHSVFPYLPFYVELFVHAVLQLILQCVITSNMLSTQSNGHPSNSITMNHHQTT